MAEMKGLVPGWEDGKWEVPDWSFDGRPALVINHMQMGIAGTGLFSGAPFAQEKKAMDDLGTVEKQKKLIAAFRARGLPVVFCSVVPKKEGRYPKWGFIFEVGRRMASTGGFDEAKTLESAQIIPELGRLPEEPLMINASHMPLSGSSLEDYLREHSVQDIVLTGWMFALFPKGPAKKVALISGLAKPEGCV